jgi:hypothetical protein
MIEEAVLDSYTEEEQATGFLTMIEEHLALPFSVKIPGVDADVEKVDMTLDGQIVGICRRGNTRQKIPMLKLAFANADSGWRGMAGSSSRIPLHSVRSEAM